MTHLWQQKSCVKIPGESRTTMPNAAAERFFQQLRPADASSAASLFSQSWSTQPDSPGSEPALYPAGLPQFLNIMFSSRLTKEIKPKPRSPLQKLIKAAFFSALLNVKTALAVCVIFYFCFNFLNQKLNNNHHPG